MTTFQFLSLFFLTLEREREKKKKRKTLVFLFRSKSFLRLVSRGGKPQKITDNAPIWGGEEQEILGVLSRRKREKFFLFDIISICKGEKKDRLSFKNTRKPK